MKVRKHFRMSNSVIEYIISDLTLNKISNKDLYFKYRVNEKIEKLNKRYDILLDKILTHIILNCSFDNLPIKSISRTILSLSKITNVLSKGLLSLVEKE